MQGAARLFSTRDDAETKLQGAFLFFSPLTPAHLRQSTSRRPHTSLHSFSLKMRKTCGYLSERRGPRVPSQDFQWLPVDELGQGRGEPHNPERQGSRQGGAGVWSRGECWARRRRLQSEPALHPNQRCGGCAARPSIFHTKGRLPPSPRSPPRQPTHDCGAGRRGKEEGDRHIDRDRKAQ